MQQNIARYADLPRDARQCIPDLLDTDGTIHRIIMPEHRFNVRTQRGGWVTERTFRNETDHCQEIRVMLTTGAVFVHVHRDGSTTPFESVSVAESAPVHEMVQTGANSLSPVSCADETAAVVSAQWTRAQNGLGEIIRFGAMMVAIDRALAPSNKRAGLYGGKTLKGWLSEHCPEINYNTARGYRDAALGVAAAAELPDALPLLALMDGAADEMDATRARVMQIISGASIALLKGASRRGGARPGAGRPVKTLADPDVALEEALRCALRLTDMVRRWAIDEDGLGTLPDGPLETFLANMGDVCKRGREILSGRAAASKRRV